MLSKLALLVLSVLFLRGNGTPVKNPLRRLGSASGRIVGGIETAINRFPYQVGINFMGYFHCGGSILRTNVIITAADCVAWYPPYMLSLFFGTSSSLEGGVRREVDYIIHHENFDFDTHDFDIGIVFLKRHLEFSETIQPIALASSNERVAPGSKGYIAGWGTLEETGELEEKLHYAAVTIVDIEVCKKAYEGLEVITPSMICASGEAYGGTDPCISDFGTPLVVAGKVYGYVSFSEFCHQPGLPRIYANVAYLREWIDEKLLHGKGST